MSDSIHDFARIIDTTDEPTGTEVIDDFEDGETTSPLASDWSGGGETSNTTATSTDPLEGSFSALMPGDGDTLNYDRAAPAKISEFRVLLKIGNQTGQSGDSATTRFTSSAGAILQFSFRYNGGISVGSENDSNSTNGTWSTNTTYRVRAYNIDWSANTFDFEIIRVSDSVVIRNGNADMRNAADYVDGMNIFNDLSEGGSSEYRYDVPEVTY